MLKSDSNQDTTDRSRRFENSLGLERVAGACRHGRKLIFFVYSLALMIVAEQCSSAEGKSLTQV
jgi:hypothetical protein